jgi:hypothetical protein
MQRLKTQPNRPFDHQPPRRQPPARPAAAPEDTARALDRWADEELFEEDLRAVMRMIRPHRRERLLGWNEHRTGGRHFRATISWDDNFAADASANPDPTPADDAFTIPNLADILESLVTGALRPDADRATACQALLRDLTQRLRTREF